MNDFDIATDKFDQSAQRVMGRAAEESRRREHAIVGTEHLFLALAQVEWDTFSHVTQDLEVNPHVILDALEARLERLPTLSGREPRLAPSTKNVVKLAFLRASRDGRTIASPDLFSAILEESHGVPVSIVRRHGLSPDVFASRITTHMRDHELREEQLRKRLELPETLRRVATNMNLLARQKQNPAGLRPRQGNPAGARDPLPPRALEFGDADRRTGRRQDGDRGGPGATTRVGARIGAGAAARLSGRKPPDEQPGGGDDAARHVRGPNPERD